MQQYPWGESRGPVQLGFNLPSCIYLHDTIDTRHLPVQPSRTSPRPFQPDEVDHSS